MEMYWLRYKELLLNNKYKVLIAIAVLGLLVILSSKIFMNKPKAKGAIIKPLVRTMVVTKQPMYKNISLFGKTTALAKINIVNKYAGRIAAVNVDLGDEVNVDDILIEQELQDIDLKIAEAKAKYGEYHGKALAYETEYKASFDRYKATYELHKANYERYQKLLELGAVSKLEVDNVKQTMLASKANYEELANQVQMEDMPAAVFARMQDGEQKYNDYLLLLNQRNDMVMKAPRKGIISYRNAEVGNYAPAGTKLLTIVDNSSVYVDCVVSESDAALLNVDQEVDVNIEVLGETFPAKVIYVSPASGEETNGFAVRLALLKTSEAVKAGMFAKSEFKYLQKENTISLNKTSVVEKNGKYYVFVIKDKNKVEQRAIKTGIRNDTQVEITSGISEGETIVIDNLSRLRNGVAVDVQANEDGKL